MKVSKLPTFLLNVIGVDFNQNSFVNYEGFDALTISNEQAQLYQAAGIIAAKAVSNAREHVLRIHTSNENFVTAVYDLFDTIGIKPALHGRKNDKRKKISFDSSKVDELINKKITPIKIKKNPIQMHGLLSNPKHLEDLV